MYHMPEMARLDEFLNVSGWFRSVYFMVYLKPQVENVVS